MDCEKCEYYNVEEENCGAFECNGIGCPDLPCEQWWVFTFGYGQGHVGYYVKIRGTHDEARRKMFEKYGEHWGFQYSEQQWDEWSKKCNPAFLEKELEVID